MKPPKLSLAISIRHGDGSFEDNGSRRMTDQEAIKVICELCSCTSTQEIGGWNNERRDIAVTTILNNSFVSIRQLSRLTGISKAIIERICRK